MQAVWEHWSDLPDRAQQLLLMRFYGNMTQAEIGARLGISQMHVSRLLAEAIAYLRAQLIDVYAGTAPGRMTQAMSTTQARPHAVMA